MAEIPDPYSKNCSSSLEEAPSPGSDLDFHDRLHSSGSHSSQAPELPIELIEMIVAHLFDDPPSLRNSSLVCSSWTDACQYILFRRIRLDLMPSRSMADYNSLIASRDANMKCQAFLSCGEKSPNLFDYAKDLFLSCDEAVNYVRWGQQQPIISMILDRFTNVQSFRLRPRTWTELSSAVRISIKRILNLPTLTRLSLSFESTYSSEDHQTIPSVLGQLSPSLIDLSWSSNNKLRLPAPSNTIVSRKGPKISLQSLHLDLYGVGNFISWALRPDSTIDITSLKRLHLHLSRHTPHAEDSPAIIRLMEALNSTLEHFDLQVSMSRMSFTLTQQNPVINLTAFHLLRFFRVVIRDISTSFQSQLTDPVVYLTSLFSPIFTPGASVAVPLEELEILVYLMGPNGDDIIMPYNDEGVVNSLLEARWCRVDQILSLTQFAALQKVTFVFHLPGHLSEQLLKKIGALQFLMFPSLSRRNIFNWRCVSI